MEVEATKRILSALNRRWGALLNQQVVNVVAYGSGAFPQTKDKKVTASNTLDLLVQVRNPFIFHSELIKISPNDYSGAASIFGSTLLNWTNQSLFPMHSNHIDLQSRKVKYSVIGKTAFRKDLKEWKYLSFAGRLHKPVLPIKPYSDGLGEDINRNRETAAAVALLLYGGKGRLLSHAEYFQKISEISYIGDVRFSAGAQNPQKTQNIVNHNYYQFQQIYIPILKKMSSKIPTSLTIERDQLSFLYTAQSLAFLLPYLPSSLLDPISQLYPGEKNLIDRILLGGSANLPKDISQTLTKINRKNSFWMATQNLVSASPVNNLKYLLAKVGKKNQK